MMASRSRPETAVCRPIIIMGVSGSGKSTVGEALADRTGWSFADADDFHPPANRAKMQNGTPLSDRDREGWLNDLNAILQNYFSRGEPVILACSALKERYRKLLAAGISGCHWVCLSGAPELLRERMRQRGGHFMPISLLESQLAALEVPSDALIVDVAMSPEAIVERIIRHFRL